MIKINKSVKHVINIVKIVQQQKRNVFNAKKVFIQGTKIFALNVKMIALNVINFNVQNANYKIIFLIPKINKIV